MSPMLGYIKAKGRLELYSSRLVADCLGGAARVLTLGGGACCVGGGEDCTSTPDGDACVFSGTLLNLKELSCEYGVEERASALCLAMYHSHGEDFTEKLNGPFVLALFDGAKGCLRLYRDHLGQRPLYYSMLSCGTTVFSDALPRLLHLPGCASAMDVKALADYLSLGYVPAPETIYSGISKLSAGHCLTLRGLGGLPSLHRYWRPQFVPKSRMRLGEAVGVVWERVSAAVERCCAVSPGCGVLLSGGLDSNIIMALGATSESRLRQSFTVGFEEAPYDERGLAGRSAAHLGVENVQRCVTPGDWELLGLLETLNGEPFADSSLIPTAAAMRLASESVPSVLTGAGGDELFGGYRRYQAMVLRRCLCVVPRWLLSLAGRVALGLLPNHRDGRTRLATARRLASFLQVPYLEGYMSFQEIFSQDMKREVLRDSRVQEQASCVEEFACRVREGTATSFAEQFNELDVLTYLPDDGSVKERLAASFAGVRSLSPLLDMNVVSAALALPRRLRVTLFRRKLILREMGRAMLSSELLVQGKRGFGMPVSSWFRGVHSGTARELAETLSVWDEQGWFDHAAVSRLVSEHCTGRADHGCRLWSMLCLKEWLEGRRRR